MNTAINETILNPDEMTFEENHSGLIKQIQYLHKRHGIFKTLVDTLRPLAVHLTGQDDLDVLNVQMFEKHPHISKETRAHQDNAYFKVTPATALTFWLSLDTITEENGALYYAPYTNLTPTRRHSRYHKNTTFRVRSGVPGLSLCLHEHPCETDVRIDTQPGDLLVHNCNTVHRAGKNTSDRRRRAIGVVFIPKNCQRDERLYDYFQKQLEEDIELQRIKDPQLYERLTKEFEKK